MPPKQGHNRFGKPTMFGRPRPDDVGVIDADSDDDEEDEEEEENSSHASELKKGGRRVKGRLEQRFGWMGKRSGEEGKYDDALEGVSEAGKTKEGGQGVIGGVDQRLGWMSKSSGEEGKYDDAPEDSSDEELSQIPGKGSALDRLKSAHAKRKRQKDSEHERHSKKRREKSCDTVTKQREQGKQQEKQQWQEKLNKERVKKQEISDWLKLPLRYPNKPEQGWHGVEMLGQGGQGRTGLWVHVNNKMKIDDRMAVKDVSHAPSPYYDDDEDNPNDIYWTASEPREAHIGMLLADSPGIVKTRNFSGSKAEERYRLYMDFAGHGSLESLLELQIEEVQVQENNVSKVMKLPRPYPEPFIWFVLTRLARAAETLAEPTKIREKYKNWKDVEVVHHDIKADNVFLGAPDPGSFPFYPSPLIGDFGSARITYKKDDSNPFSWQTWITKGYIPPDLDRILDRQNEQDIRQARQKKRKAPPRRRHTQAINVWQIGQICRMMMILGNAFLACAEQINYSTRTEDRWKLSMADLAEEYSAELVTLVASCLDPDPGLRPKPNELVAKCAQNDKRLDGMAARTTAATKTHNMLRYERGKDNYKDGMTLNLQPASGSRNERKIATL